MPYCSSSTRKGKPCPNVGDRLTDNRWYCHVHDPNGVFQMQQRQKPRGAKLKPMRKAKILVNRREVNYNSAALTPAQRAAMLHLPKNFTVDPHLPLSPDEIQPCDRPPYL